MIDENIFSMIANVQVITAYLLQLFLLFIYHVDVFTDSNV